MTQISHHQKQRVLHRERLLAPLRTDENVVLTAPHGYGKSTLLQQYADDLQRRGQAFVILSCLPEDRQAQILAQRLVFYTMRASGQRIFEGISSEYSAQHHKVSTPSGNALLIASDLNDNDLDLTLIIDGVVGREASEFLAELAVRAPRQRFVISGYSDLRNYFHAQNNTTFLNEHDLAFTEEETLSLGLSTILHELHQAWPAAIALSALGGTQSARHFAQQLTQQLAQEEPELLPAALLDIWSDTIPVHVERALGLPANWYTRYQQLGWPMLPITEGQGMEVHPLLHRAMLDQLAEMGHLREYREALAAIVEEAQPIWALELRSQNEDTSAVLLQARKQVSTWLLRGQWSQLKTYLELAFAYLEPDEIIALARAYMHLAHHERDLNRALVFCMQAEKLGATQPEGLILHSEILQRLGRLDAMVKVLEDAPRQRGDHQLLVNSWLILGYVTMYQPQLAALTLQGSQMALADGLPIFDVALAAYSLSQGEQGKALERALKAYLAYFFSPDHMYRDIWAVTLLINVLLDLDSTIRADHLMKRLPVVAETSAQASWIAASLELLRAQERFRSLDFEETYIHLNTALSMAGEGLYVDLQTKIYIQFFLLHVRLNEYDQAHDILAKLNTLSSGNMYMREILHQFHSIIYLSELPGMPLPKSYQTQSYLESYLVLQRIIKGSSVLEDLKEQFGSGTLRTWEHWEPKPARRELPRYFPEFDNSQPTLKDRIELYALKGPLHALVNGKPLQNISPRGLAILILLACEGKKNLSELHTQLFSDKTPKYVSVVLSGMQPILDEAFNLEKGSRCLRFATGVYGFPDNIEVYCDLKEVLQGSPEQAVKNYQAPLIVKGNWFFISQKAVRHEVKRKIERLPPEEREQALQEVKFRDRQF